MPSFGSDNFETVSNLLTTLEFFYLLQIGYRLLGYWKSGVVPAVLFQIPMETKQSLILRKRNLKEAVPVLNHLR